MGSRALPAWLAPLSGALFALIGCRACDDLVVAEVVLTVERVERDHSTDKDSWKAAKPGMTMGLGDGLRTYAEARAELALRPSGTLRVEQDTTVRFEASRKGAPQRVAIETGAVELVAAGVELELDTDVGLARLSRGSSVRVRKNGARSRFDVKVGKVQVERDGEMRTAAAGEGFELEVGKPLIEPTTPPPAEPVATAGAPAVAPEDTGPVRFDPSPPRADLTVPAGETATLHDPSPPSRVQLTFPGCPGELAIETAHGNGGFGEQRVRGRGGAVLRLSAGRHRYRVLCIEQGKLSPRALADGALTVLKDAGERRLVDTAPAVNVEADGRRYTVRYQNRLPTLTLRWPGAPQAASYQLRIAPEKGVERTRSLREPNATLRSGELGEGLHRFQFQAGQARSPEGTLRIVFDNTGRVAFLSSPSDHGFAAGQPTKVSGAAISKASVRIAGEKVTPDAEGRFAATANAPRLTDALEVRVQHPSTGVHYFLRRVSGAGSQ